MNLLKAEGYACFIPDKRGVGDSGGSLPEVSTGNSKEKIQLLADDLLAAVNYMKNLREISTEQIGLMGGSQAGWVIPLAASQSDIADFTVIVNGATVPLGVSVYWEKITLDGRLRSVDRPGHLIPMDETRRQQLSEQLASFDYLRKQRPYRRASRVQIEPFCPLILSSEVSVSKVAVFLLLQN